jgi:drug/metabolite transporter (DMT)-like permease
MEKDTLSVRCKGAQSAVHVRIYFMSNYPASSPGTLIGIALMLSAMTVLPFLDVVAKYLGQQGVPVIQIVWARMTFGCLLTLPFALRVAGPASLLPKRPVLHGFRAGFLISATFCFFVALRYLSIADALAIFFVQPLIVTILSPLVLGEHVGPRRWAAVVTGFIGTLIIIRPGFQEINPGIVFALGAGASLACYMLMTRRISGQSHAAVTTFQTNAIGAAIVSVFAIYGWQPPTLWQWGLFVLLAFFASAGHFLIVRAYDYSEASLLAPFAYSEIIMATILGWWFFGDFPDHWTFVGVGILISSAVYISIREQARGVMPSVTFEQPSVEH